MAKRKKEIDWKKTVLSSIWIYAIFGFITINAVLFTVRNLAATERIDAICFWALMAIFFMMRFTNMLKDLTFFVYKENKNDSPTA